MARSQRNRRLPSLVLLGLATLAVWSFVLTMTVPRAITGAVGDYGFFTAVADRLRAGETLYAQIWDNKDPFVFYSMAVARTFGVGGAWALEILWVALVAIATFFIGRRSGVSRDWSVFVAFALAPLVLLGMPYFMGSTHVPGVALTLLALALMLSNRPAWAGLPFAVLLFFKFVMWPLALVVVVVAAVTRGEARRLVRFGVVAVVATIAISAVMAIRGEFTGFLETQIDNVLYSQSPIVSAAYTGLVQKVGQHIVILINPHIIAVELTSVAILVLGLVAYRRRISGARWYALPTLWWVSFAAFAVEGVIIAVTGKWFHHAEVFAVSSVLLLVLLVDALRNAWRVNALVTVAAAVVSTYLLAAMPPIADYSVAVRSVSANWAAANEPDRMTRMLQSREPTSIAFIGMGNNLPRTGGLDDWTVACRQIAQRPFNPQRTFDETVSCLPSAQTVVVANDYARDPAFPAYAAFYDQVEAILSKDFTCKAVEDFRVCSRTVGSN